MACTGALWPSPIRLPIMMHWLSLRHCQICGEDLALQLPGDGESDQWSATLNPLPHLIGLRAYWDGIHTLSQLMLRKLADRLRQSEYVPNRAIFSDSDHTWHHIEEVPLHARVLVMNNCEALLQNWPETFVVATQAAGISKVSFSGLDLPSWMNEIVDSHLAIRRRNQFSPDYIQERIRTEQSTHGKISKALIRRSLGVVENSVLNRLMSQRRRAHPSELLKMITLFRLEVECTSSERCKLTSLWRDYLIFLLSVVSQKSVMEVCRWSKQQCLTVLEREYEGAERVIAVKEAKNAMRIYSMNAPNDVSASMTYFTSRFGIPLADHGIRQRVSAMMKSHFPPNLWRSMDVFTKVFSNAGRSRRSAKSNG